MRLQRTVFKKLKIGAIFVRGESYYVKVGPEQYICLGKEVWVNETEIPGNMGNNEPVWLSSESIEGVKRSWF